MDESQIYKYIDKKGIPFRKMTSTNIIGNAYGIIKDSYPKQFIKIELPFELSQKQQINLVIKYIYDLTGFEVNDINDLLSLKSLYNKPFILELNEHSNPILYVAFKKIPGSLIIRGDQKFKDNGSETKTLGNIEIIKGDLGLSNTEILDLGNLKEIMGDFWFSGTEEFKINGFKIQTLSPLEKVIGSVSIRGNSLETLGTLEYVGKNLSLRFSNVKDLGQLKHVGGNLLLSKYNIEFYDLNKIEVKGKILSYNDKKQ